MLREFLHGNYPSWYLNSPHKERIDRAGQSLLAKNYGKAVIQQHLCEWIQFTHWLDQNNIPLPLHLFAKDCEHYFQARCTKIGASRRRVIRASVRILLMVDESGHFPRRATRPEQIQSVLYQRYIPEHLRYLRQCRNLSEQTLRRRQAYLKRFMDFLSGSGVNNMNVLTPKHILDSFSELKGWAVMTRSSYASALRSFLRWAYAENILPSDLSAASMTVRHYRDAALPEVLSDDEVDKLLGSVDRRTALGRRDYAILLLSARYGLRPCDIRQLCLENIHWREGEILLTQSKTSQLLRLPLLDEVTEALIDYLKAGRPATDSRQVFVRHLAPHEPFVPGNNMADIMRRALAQAGMSSRTGLRGLYLFRHSLATRLLREGNGPATIAAVLGHRDISSTLIYVKVNLPQLQTVAMSIAAVRS